MFIFITFRSINQHKAFNPNSMPDYECLVNILGNVWTQVLLTVQHWIYIMYVRSKHHKSFLLIKLCEGERGSRHIRNGIWSTALSVNITHSLNSTGCGRKCAANDSSCSCFYSLKIRICRFWHNSNMFPRRLFHSCLHNVRNLRIHDLWLLCLASKEPSMCLKEVL